jgi:glutathione S-transferase
MDLTLYIGNRNYSSWSLRPWLCLRWAKLAFSEVEIDLAQPGYGVQGIAEILAVAPNGRVPALDVDGLVIWDSLAIAEWVAEQVPAGLWPEDPARRAIARSVTAEMHSGFAAVRRDLSMNIRRRSIVAAWPDDTRRDIARIDQLIGGLRRQHAGQGPWLFGERCIADAFYAPVATRFRSYGVSLSADAASWCETVFADADFRAWEAQCVPDSWDRPGYPIIDGLHRGRD